MKEREVVQRGGGRRPEGLLHEIHEAESSQSATPVALLCGAVLDVHDESVLIDEVGTVKVVLVPASEELSAALAAARAGPRRARIRARR